MKRKFPEVIRTEWMNGHTTQPGEPGCYERDFASTFIIGPSILFCWWDGIEWYASGNTPAQAHEIYSVDASVSGYQNLPWRGCKEQQNG